VADVRPWIVDVLPEAAAERVASLTARGAAAMRDALAAMSRVTPSHDADADGPTGGPVAR
jgi:hypothetical protein